MTTSTDVAQWTAVCPVSHIIDRTGVCAKVADQQVAVFRLGDQVFAIDNYDPCSGAFVLSRGIVGSQADKPVVSSPLYKQHFELATGRCMEDEAHSVKSWPVRVVDGTVEVGHD